MFTLRSWDDSRTIRDAATHARRAVIVGAGFIGLEGAASLSNHGAAVTVVAPESTPLEKQFGSEVGHVFLRLHQQHGTSFRLGRTVKRFLGEEELRGVELDNGEQLEAQLAVVAVGIRPATDFLRGVTLNQDGSVDVDRQLRIAGNVFAAGDIARYPDPFSNRRFRVEHWRLALQHGRTAGQMMMRWSAPFMDVPFFWTRQFGVSLLYAGHATEWDEVIMTGRPEELDFTAFYAKDQELLAAGDTNPEELLSLQRA